MRASRCLGFVGGGVLAWAGLGCDPAENDYLDRARQDFEPRSGTLCCDDKCTDADMARCAFLKEARIVNSAMTTKDGPPGKLHRVVLDVEGANGKGRCTFHYWNTGSTIQTDINRRGPKCVASTRQAGK